MTALGMDIGLGIEAAPIRHPRPFSSGRCRSAAQVRHLCTCSAASQSPQSDPRRVDRRQLFAAALAIAVGQGSGLAQAFTPPPAGKRRNVDVLDGYSFLYPEYWSVVTTSGNDIFYRNPYNVEENLFVNISSPSSSKFDSVEDLKSPAEAAARLKSQYLGEFMSTRLGSRKVVDILSANTRKADDGKLYYDIEMRARSYASRNPLASTQSEVDAGQELEWDRRLLTTLGVANKRLYEMRIQTLSASFQNNADQLREVATSFRCNEVVA